MNKELRELYIELIEKYPDQTWKCSDDNPKKSVIVHDTVKAILCDECIIKYKDLWAVFK